jgi:hypothetical protein
MIVRPCPRGEKILSIEKLLKKGSWNYSCELLIARKGTSPPYLHYSSRTFHFFEEIIQCKFAKEKLLLLLVNF